VSSVPTMPHGAVCTALALLAIAIAGCSSTSGEPGDGTHGVRIAEYVGDGHGGTNAVRLAALSGDPDAYVQRTSSTGFVGRHKAAGSGDVAFTPGETAYHYIRVHGYTTCQYSIRVKSP